jgi:outer membrane protein OmpU
MTETEGKIMKKILIATTALVATAEYAAADISVYGFGRLGMTYASARYNETATPGNGYTAGTDNLEQKTQFEHRLRFGFKGTAQSDSGMTFTGDMRFQADDSASGVGDTAQGGGSTNYAPLYTVSYNGLTIKAGNTAIAQEQAMYYVGSLGYTGFMYANPRAYNGDTNNSNWSSTTDFEINASYSMNGFTIGAGTSDNAAGVSRNVVTASYTIGNTTIGATTQASEAAARAQDYTALAIMSEIGGVKVGLYGDDYKDGTNGYGFTASTEIQPGLTISATWSTLDDNVAGNTDEAYGVGFSYDLGGGVSLGGGVGKMRNQDDTLAWNSGKGINYSEVGIVFNF